MKFIIISNSEVSMIEIDKTFVSVLCLIIKVIFKIKKIIKKIKIVKLPPNILGWFGTIFGAMFDAMFGAMFNGAIGGEISGSL